MSKEQSWRTRSSWLRFAAGNFWLVLGSIWFAVGSLFFIVGLFAWIQISGLDQRFEQDARTVQGTVLSKASTSTSSGFGSHRSYSRSYDVTFRFDTSDGRQVEDTAGVYSDAWDQLAEGGPIQVTYLPDEPLTNRVEGRTDAGSAAADVLMGGLLAVVGGSFFFWHMRRFLRTSRLRRDGGGNRALMQTFIS